MGNFPIEEIVQAREMENRGALDKGYVQLAIRSGQYKKLNVLPIKEGELKKWDPLNEEIEVDLIQDEAEREKRPTIGYYAMFEYVNGFRKALYWSRQKMEAHAKRYSKAFTFSKDSFWAKDFDAMAIKTMLRQLISKWGIMSVEMQTALRRDGMTPVLTADEKLADGEYMENDIVDVEAQPVEPEQPAEEEQLKDCPREEGCQIKVSECKKCKERKGCPAWAEEDKA